MNNLLRIIHLSDLHLGYKDCQEKAERIAQNIIKTEKPSETAIVITGDIVEHGASKEELVAGLKLLADLRGNGFTVLICPGNHDYGTGFINSEKTAKNFRKVFLPEIKEFPSLDIIGNAAFIGLDSTSDELHWYDRFFADGELGKSQIFRLEKIMNDPSIQDHIKVVYLHHHPIHFLPFFRLKDRMQLKRIIQNKVDLLLFGHLHFGALYRKVWGIKVVADGGSSTGKPALGMFKTKVHHRVISLINFGITEKNYL
jgi:predicted MPP superfamily phosphohydrolase